jgi:hypothetical protein
LLKANTAREFGARVYCVGVKDFDESQVSVFRDLFHAVLSPFYQLKAA